VMLQGEFSYRLQCFFRSQGALAPLVADEFFCLLHDHGIRLQMVIDNAFDACGMRFEGNTLINLGRRAFNLGHHLIVITQSPGKAEEVSGLNGARTRLAMAFLQLGHLPVTWGSVHSAVWPCQTCEISAATR